MVAAFDDYRPLAAIPVEAAMEAAVVVTEFTVTEFGACTEKVITIAELAAFMKTVTADANADPKFLRATDGRRRNGDSRERCKRKAKLCHLQSSRSQLPFI
jgi:hypothetical protein